MPIRRLDRREAVASGMILVAGILAIASWKLHWAELTFPRTGTQAVTVPVGHEKIGLYLGILLLVRALVPWFSRPEVARRWMAWALISGAIIAGFAIFDLATEKTRAVDILIANTARGTGQPAGQVSVLIHGQVAQGLVKVTFSAGIYLALVAAALAMLAGILNFTWARHPIMPPAPVPPPPEPEGTGSFWAKPES